MGKIEAQRDSRSQGRRREGCCRPQRDARRHRSERSRRPLVKESEHTTTEVALDGSTGNCRRQLVKSDRRLPRVDEIELIREPMFERNMGGGLEPYLVDAIQNRGCQGGRRLRKCRQCLPKARGLLGPISLER